MLRVAVLVSGGGTNLQAILDAKEKGMMDNAQIVTVVSNNQRAYALERAKLAGVGSRCIRPKDYENRQVYTQAMIDYLNEEKIDLVVLAGFLVVLEPSFIEAFRNRIINIHPSLIPAFCGEGYYGLKVHEAALKRGVKLVGATVHFVDEGTDTGPIVAQKAVEVMDDDTPEILQRRVMEQAEWPLLPMAIEWIAQGVIEVIEGRVIRRI